MIDGCADTGVAAIGNGMVEVYTTDRQVSLIGFQDDLAKHNIPIGGAAAAIDLPQGTIIVQLNEVPLLKGGSNSLLSTNQAREFGIIVDDVARRYGGKQQLQANDTVIPLQYQRALMSTPIREPTKWELDNLPRVMLTSDEPWDPTVINESLEGQVIFPDDLDITDDAFDYVLNINKSSQVSLNPVASEPEPPNYQQYVPCLGFISLDKVKDIFKNTTQLATNWLRLPLRRHFKSRFPQLNRPRLQETYSTDTLFSSVPGIGGHTCVQAFVGKKSMYTKVYGMSSESQGKDALEDFIAEVGAPRHIMSDNAQMERSKAWRDILRKYNISSSTTEPHHPWQNPAERRIQDLKKGTNRILDRTSAPSYLWYYALLLWVGILNIMSEPSLGGRTPTEVATGVTPDISPYIHFTFYQPIYYYDEAEKYPSTKEQLGFSLGPSEHCGNALTYWVLTEDHRQVLARSTVRPADDATTLNRRRNNPFRDEGGKKALVSSPDQDAGLAKS